MLYQSKTISLKNGTEAYFRSPLVSDASEMMDFLKTCAFETLFILRYPEECIETAEQESNYLEGINKSETGIMLVCVIDGKIAGNCQVMFQSRIKTKHRASVAIGLLQRYWQLGIGTAMFREMIAIAKNMGVLQLELDYIEGNVRAKSLYEKMGFVQVAERPDAIRLKDGQMLKEISMIRKLEL